MIQIEFTDNEGCISVTATGHAGAAPKGQDIICAGISALMMTLAFQVMTLKEWRYFLSEPEISMEDGNAVIRCRPKDGVRWITKQYFEMIEGGCLLIEMDHGSYVNVTTFEGGAQNEN